MDYIINESGQLEFPGLRVGNLITGAPLSWDELRQIVITATRFASGRPVQARTRAELLEAYQAASQEAQGLKADMAADEIHNLKQIIFALQGQLADTNKELNTLRKKCFQNFSTAQG